MVNSHNILLSQGASFSGNGKCRSCSQPVRWYKTRTGAKQPFDPPQLEAGRSRDDCEMTSHFATCPQSAEHKAAADAKRWREENADKLKRQPSLFGTETHHA